MSVVIGAPLSHGLVSATRLYRNFARDHLSRNLHHSAGFKTPQPETGTARKLTHD